MGRGEQFVAAGAGRRRRDMPEVSGELALTLIDEALLDEHGGRPSEAYPDLAQRFKKVADQAFTEYRRATDLWVLCEQKAKAAARQERREQALGRRNHITL